MLRKISSHVQCQLVLLILNQMANQVILLCFFIYFLNLFRIQYSQDILTFLFDIEQEHWILLVLVLYRALDYTLDHIWFFLLFFFWLSIGANFLALSHNFLQMVQRTWLFDISERWFTFMIVRVLSWCFRNDVMVLNRGYQTSIWLLFTALITKTRKNWFNSAYLLHLIFRKPIFSLLTRCTFSPKSEFVGAIALPSEAKLFLCTIWGLGIGAL